jgi:hypothetical protein
VRAPLALAALACAADVVLGCAAPPYEARGTYSPADAARILKERPAHAWVVRSEARVDLGDGARIEPDGERFRALAPKTRPGSHVRKLLDGDVVVMDEENHLVAIRSKSGVETRFAPGTASLPPDSDEVLVQEAAAPADGVRIEAGDKVEVLAAYAPGDVVPGQGHVEEERKVIPLVAGALLLTITYGPAAYVGLSSSLKVDRVLLLPALGPWIDLLARPKCTPPPGSDALPVDSCTGETGIKVGLVASGLGQVLGIVLVGLGLPAEAVLVKDRAATLRLGPFGARGEF